MNNLLIGIIALAVMVVLIMMGMHIGFVFTLIGCVGYALIVNMNASLGLLRTAFYTTAANFSYGVIPLFILMGELCFRSGLSKDLYSTANKWLSWAPGGLACANIAACAIFGAICGSLAATTATMGTIAIPEMRKHHYDDSLSCGSVAAGGTLGILIPPSTSMIVYGIASEESIGKLFMAGIIPGIICAVVMIVTVVVWVSVKPSIAPRGEKYTMKERLSALRNLVGIIVVFGITFGGMGTGLFTINEAAAVGAFLSLMLMIVRRQFSLKNLLDSFLATVKTASMVYLLMMGASVMVPFIAKSGIPGAVSGFVAGSGMSKYIFILGVVILYCLLGCIIDGISLILLTVPIFLPIVLEYGMSAIWFGVLLTLVGQIGAITPPVGLNCYVLAGVVKDVPLQKIFRSIVPFIISLLITIVIIVMFPILSTWLPGMMR